MRKLYNKTCVTLDNKELVSYYQPIFDTNSNSIIGLEALVRRKDESGNILLPSEFIPNLEGSVFMPCLTEFMLINVIGDMKYFPQDIWVSINVSSDELESGILFDLLSHFNFPYQNRLFFELTERSPISHMEAAKIEVNRLADKGYHLKLDDFGTGFGTFSYIKTLNIKSIKIDKEFTDTILDSTHNINVLKGMISFAHQCGLEIIAEGVEHAKQAQYLKRHDVHLQQGYYYYKPMPIEDMMWYMYGRP
ncbi:EAL domain-containing protein [Aeromonas hydrophila]|uniref:EAL domain-containing protein n=1 Tax=Aeromonas hydrophila TaxID=644 RepID=UPI00130DFA17|nr:EAL domain-containing protein [Aeromonas hydrophila]MCA4698767.1 EAL domain-containing protein [Aeromonas hydrophila]MCO4221771.1 EAL domain-containing protein [Aeromonas hydrophila]QIO17496.1 EAL domain-containing protein [Aeromonas hydrophila]UUT51670.1 EAL domain-containing protein [Aeromonas hydrophila]WEF00910.1 EAL domain-containing protein [Aeromonas hydrophila]